MKDLILLLCFLSTSTAISAQWESLQGPYGGNITDLVQNDIFQFAATDHGIYRSEDKGLSWNQLIIDSLPGYIAEKLSVYQDHVLARVRTGNHLDVKLGFYKSSNNGDSWEEIITPDSVHFAQFAINEFGIYISDYHHLLFSTDGGVVWNTSSINHVGFFKALDVTPNKIYVASSNRIYESATGDNWNVMEVNDLIGNITSIHVFGDIMFAHAEGASQLYRSGDGGDIWLKVPGLSLSNSEPSMIKIGDSFLMLGWGEILRSDDKGITWESGSEYLWNASNMINIGSLILIGAYGPGIIRTEDLAETFKLSNQGLDAALGQSIAVDENNIWTSSINNGLAGQSKLSGLWDTVGLSPKYEIADILIHQDKIFVTYFYTVFRSEDDGETWTHLSQFLFNEVNRLYTFKDDILTGGISSFGSSLLWVSHDSGDSWEVYNFIIEDKVRYPFLFASRNNTIVTSDWDYIYRSPDGGSSWDIISNDELLDTCNCYITDLIVTDELIMALTIGQPFGLRRTFISRDDGVTWEFLEDQSESVQFTGFSFATHYDNILLGVGSIPTNGLFVSFDHAVTWSPFMEGLTTSIISEIVFDEEYIYAATYGQGVWRRKIEDLYTTSLSNQTSKSNQISIYPNPSDGNFRLQVDATIESDGQLKITDTHGHIYISEKIQYLPSIELHAPDLIPGIYFVSVQTSSGIYSGKMLVQK